MNESISGVINVLKPTGISSHGVVNILRGIFETKKVGHTGTLDPGAAGVLPICIEKATRISEYLMEKNKTYFVHIVFGSSTDTFDSLGTVTASSERIIDIDILNNIIKNFSGNIEQLVPAYSAKKIDGEKLYDLARKGLAPTDIKKDVTVNSIEIVSQLCTNKFLLKINCSKGTYIRSICHEIGLSLGVPAHMGALIRTNSGDFDIANSYTFDELKRLKEQGQLNQSVISIEETLKKYPCITISKDFEKYVQNGRKIPIVNADIQKDEVKTNIYKCFCNDIFYGIASIEDDMVVLNKLLK